MRPLRVYMGNHLCHPTTGSDGGVWGSCAEGKEWQEAEKGKLTEKEKYRSCVKEEPQLDEV